MVCRVTVTLHNLRSTFTGHSKGLTHRKGGQWEPSQHRQSWLQNNSLLLLKLQKHPLGKEEVDGPGVLDFLLQTSDYGGRAVDLGIVTSIELR